MQFKNIFFSLQEEEEEIKLEINVLKKVCTVQTANSVY